MTCSRYTELRPKRQIKKPPIRSNGSFAKYNTRQIFLLYGTIEKNRFFPLKVLNDFEISQEWGLRCVYVNLLNNTETNIDPNEACRT